MLFCTFNVKLGGEDPTTWICLSWQTPHRAGALQQWKNELEMSLDWINDIIIFSW